MDDLSMLKRLLEIGHANDAFEKLTPRTRLLLVLYIFFTFAPIGILLELMRAPDTDPWWGVTLWCVYCGCVSVGWALSFMWRLWLLPIVLIGQFTLGSALARFIGLPWKVDSHLALLVAVCIGLIVIGFVLFNHFVEREAARRQRLQAELDIAQRIHRRLVPPIEVTTPTLEIYARSDASAAMGGDLLDLVDGGQHLDLYVADVSGHGVGAGVVMGMLKSAIRMRLQAPGPLDALVNDLNRVVENLTEPQMFATFACLRFAGGGRVEYALAGHLPILRWSAAVRSVVELENEHLPLGVLKEEAYTSRTVEIARGDVFAVFTDGLTEAFGADHRQFGHARIGELLKQNAARPLAEIHAAVMDAVRAHGKQYDDQTLLLARVL